MHSTMIDTVRNILREAAATKVMPRFARLDPADIESKAPGEPVTVADREAEAMITAALLAVDPTARVIGEEACAEDPSLLGTLGDGRAWLVDPIDGTANFAAGRAPFAMMVALLDRGTTIASWILDPLTDQLAVAERGSGAFIDDRRLATSRDAPALDALRGIVSTAFCPPERLAAVERFSRSVADVVPTARCAGHEYPLIATQQRDFALYWRTLAWDHAPGALILTEAGGAVMYLDGAAYDPTQVRTGLLLAINAGVSGEILSALSRLNAC
jgi:fructose-1,6-bisphosphatase/inositol monophosphatase family enzyme